jgi:hypothetical protein
MSAYTPKLAVKADVPVRQLSAEEQHGYVQWDDINQKLAQGATCLTEESFTTNPVMKSSYSPVGTPSSRRTRITL